MKLITEHLQAVCRMWTKPWLRLKSGFCSCISDDIRRCLLVPTDLVPFYGAEEVQVGLVRYSPVNDQDLSVDDRCDGQEAENVLKQLEDLPAVSLRAVTKELIKRPPHHFINPMLKSTGWTELIVQSNSKWSQNKTICLTSLYLVFLHDFFCEPISETTIEKHILLLLPTFLW